MTCDEAANLLNARLDGELPADAAPALDAHLAECAACRELAAELDRQDAALLRAFVIRRDLAAGIADRVTKTLADDGPLPASRSAGFSLRWRWLVPVGMAAMVLLVVWLRLGSEQPPIATQPPTTIQVTTTQTTSPAPTFYAAAKLELATGDVFLCPSAGGPWTPLAKGEVVEVGAAIRTAPAATCELSIVGGGTVRLNTQTEAKFAQPRSLELRNGQVWSAVPMAAPAFQLQAGKPAAQVIGSTTLPATVEPGSVLAMESLDSNIFRCVPMTDALEAASWFDGLLLLKPPDDPEVVRRIGELLTRVAVDRARQPRRIGEIEMQMRDRGYAWCKAIAVWLADESRPANARQAGAMLLADLATAEHLPQLGKLQTDTDPVVRDAANRGMARFAKTRVPPMKG